jgi:integrase
MRKSLVDMEMTCFWSPATQGFQTLKAGSWRAPATIGRNVKRARQYFRAVRKRLLAENPMQDVKAPAQVNTARAFYVSREATEKIIAACPDAEWRLIVALARYGGLRTPSETFALTWADVDWERNRIRVPSPKTACHAGRESRMLPLFPELRPHLAKCGAARGGRELQSFARKQKSPREQGLFANRCESVRYCTNVSSTP